jgi:hypothetical protein
MKKTLLVLAVLALTSCVNQMDRLRDAQKKYPKCFFTKTMPCFKWDRHKNIIT